MFISNGFVFGLQELLGFLFASNGTNKIWFLTIRCKKIFYGRCPIISLEPRFADYDVLANTCTGRNRALADAAEAHWQAILDRDFVRFGRTMRENFEAQVAMFPNMLNERVNALIDEHRDRALGWKMSGAGGGGYLILVAEEPIPGAVRVLARRESD